MTSYRDDALALRHKSPVGDPPGAPEAKRRSGDPANYVRDADDKTWCLTCGGAVMAKTVHHSVWDGPFPCTGSGQVVTSVAPFCPVCEVEPCAYGQPIEGDRYGVKGSRS